MAAKDGIDIASGGAPPFNVIYYDTVGSTNDTARELAARGYPHGTVVVADAQERGRGRHSRQWHSPRGLNLYMSVILRGEENLSPFDAPLAGLAASLAAAEAVKRLTGADAWPKWPNDIYVGMKKLGGILLESSSRGEVLNHLIVGIGINVNMTEGDFPDDIRQSATSIAMETDERFDRGVLARGVLSDFNVCLGLIRLRREKFIERWTAACRTINSRIGVETGGGGVITGTAAGLDDRGRLMLACDDGRVVPVSASEVIHAPCR